ncbi:MAG: HEAT repeat domain-containing protein [Ruminococcus bovis]|nr:HEAT repeat domain-containing protein [Ruminococcus bovis]MDY3662700.1 HEAT repeat domain-containing protein [Ruminococcus bovis]
MVVKEKIELLNSYDELNEFTDKQKLLLRKLSYDSNSFVRGLVASLMVKFIDEFGFEILNRLSKDNNDYVRTEVFDSLSVFNDMNTVTLLQNAISTDTNNLAKSYAIMSLGDVVYSLGISNDFKEYVYKIKSCNKSKDCILSCLYCLYLFGENVIDEIFLLLNDNDYHIRLSAISILEEIVNNDNLDIITSKLNDRLKIEDCSSVIDKIKNFK